MLPWNPGATLPPVGIIIFAVKFNSQSPEGGQWYGQTKLNILLSPSNTTSACQTFPLNS